MPAAYKLFVLRDAEKELGRIPKKDVERILGRTRGLRTNPRPAGVEKLSTLERYRVRQGDWRILFEIDDDRREVTVVKIAHRREVYR